MGQIFKRQTLTGGGNANQFFNEGKVADVEYDGYAVTAADGTDLPNGPCDALYCTAGGDVAAQNVNGGVTLLDTTTLKTLPTGQIVPIQVSRVLSTNTTATDIFALYRK